MRNRRVRLSGFPILIGVFLLVIAIAFISRLMHHGETPSGARAAMKAGCSQATSSFLHHASDNWISIAAPVTELMPDGHGSSTHQRFVLKCPRQTVLIENNVDVGQRVPVTIGETVGVHGQYIWNSLGGLIHDTHHSTSSTTPSGWIYAAGKVYQ